MSDVAQKRDITDSRTIHNFAAKVTSTAKLKLLTVLTVCDIRGVGPNSWNNWKAVLLRDLYTQTLATLSEGSMSSSRPEKVNFVKTEARKSIVEIPASEIDAQFDRHYDNFWLGLDLNTQLEFLMLLKQIEPDDVQIKIMTDQNKGASRICCALPDHPGIFARLTGAIALVGANVGSSPGSVPPPVC